jgi:exoribonuclease R
MPNFIAGKVSGHRDGFGFLIPDDGGDDLFLSEKEMQKVLHGDRVQGARHRHRPPRPAGRHHRRSRGARQYPRHRPPAE